MGALNRSLVEPLIWLVFAASVMLWRADPNYDYGLFGNLAIIAFLGGLAWRQKQKMEHEHIAAQHSEYDAMHDSWLEGRTAARALRDKHRVGRVRTIAEQHADYETMHDSWLEDRAVARRNRAGSEAWRALGAERTQ